MPGLDRTIKNQINFDKAINRISADLRADFVFAPHLILFINMLQMSLLDYHRRNFLMEHSNFLYLSY